MQVKEVDYRELYTRIRLNEDDFEIEDKEEGWDFLMRSLSGISIRD